MLALKKRTPPMNKDKIFETCSTNNWIWRGVSVQISYSLNLYNEKKKKKKKKRKHTVLAQKVILAWS